MSASKSSASPEASTISVAGYKTHSPELYAKSGSKIAKRFNIQALHLLQMCFDTVTDENQQFLEIGCGVGDFTREELLPRCLPCKRLVATDVSEDMLRYAKENFSHPKLVYDVLDIGGNISSFQKMYGQFERVYSFFCLQLVNDKKVAIRNISSLLARGGECILLFLLGGRRSDDWKTLGRMERWKDYREVRSGSCLIYKFEINTLVLGYISLSGTIVYHSI